MKIEQILMASLDSEIETYEKNADLLPEPVFSKKHNNQIKKANKIAKDSIYLADEGYIPRGFGKRRFVLAVLIAIIIMASSAIAIAMVHTEYYAILKERIRELTVTFGIGNDNEKEEENGIKRAVPPEGYTLTDEVSADGIYSAFYKSGNNKEIVYHQMQVDETNVARFGADNDSKNVEHIDGVKTIIMRKGDCHILFWVEGDCSYVLVGNCELSILKEFIKRIE